MTPQNWRGARLLPPPPLRPGPRSPGPAQSARRSQSEGGKRTSRRGGGAGWRPGEAGARSGPDWAEPPRAGELGGAEGRERAEGCGRQPRPTAAGALLDPVRILVPRRRVGRGRSRRRRGGRAWAATAGGGPRTGGVAADPGRYRAGCQRVARSPRLAAVTLGPAWPHRSAEAGAARSRPGPKMLRARGLSSLAAPSGRAAPVRTPAVPGLRPGGRLAGRVGLFGFFSPPLSPPSVLSSLPAHSLGCCETSPLLRSRLPATASSNEHLCLAFNGPLLLSLLLSARFVDVVGSVL